MGTIHVMNHSTMSSPLPPIFSTLGNAFSLSLYSQISQISPPETFFRERVHETEFRNGTAHLLTIPFAHDLGRLSLLILSCQCAAHMNPSRGPTVLITGAHDGEKTRIHHERIRDGFRLLPLGVGAASARRRHDSEFADDADASMWFSRRRCRRRLPDRLPLSVRCSLGF